MRTFLWKRNLQPKGNGNMPRQSLELVREFHRACDVPDLETPPQKFDPFISELRVKLLAEEFKEFCDALKANDAEGVLDALTDLQYVLDGAYLQLGFADKKYVALEEVHRSNMSKLGEDGKPIKNEFGKVLKGPNYRPPNLSQYL